MPKLSKADFHQYQNFTVDYLLSHDYCGALLDMGLGKTVCALTVSDILLYDLVEINKILIIAPKRVVATVWKNEAKKWSHLRRLKIVNVVGNPVERLNALFSKADIYVISRDNVQWLKENFNYNTFDMVIIDELSSFKSAKSQRFKALKTMRPFMKRVIGLTGTPAPNGLLDLWPQMYLIDRGEALGRTISGYREKYFEIEIRKNQSFPTYKPKEGASEEIYNRINNFCVSMKAEDYIDMPKLIHNQIILDMDNTLTARYKEFEKSKILELINSETEITAINAGSLSGKLLQFCNGAVYDENKTAHTIHDLKLDALQDIIEEANGEPIIVAYAYRHDLARIKARLKGYDYRELNTEKDEQDWNAGNIQILIVHPASTGHGLNLQFGGHTIVWFGLTWSLELFLQLIARLQRQGQKHPFVMVHYILLRGTYEFEMVKSLTEKNATQSDLLNALKAKIKQYSQLKNEFNDVI